MTLPIGKIVSGVVNTIDELHTSKEEEMKIAFDVRKIEHDENIGQIETNKIEASHKSMFVAGWRPFIGWVCGTALLYNFIVKDLIEYYLAIRHEDVPSLPSLQMEQLMTILLGMLGLGAARTVEKIRKVNSDSLSNSGEKNKQRNGFLGGFFKGKNN